VSELFSGRSEGRRPNLVLHVRAAAPSPTPAATITGNRAALLALRDLIDAALESEASNATRAFREADGADFQLAVWVAKSREAMGEPAGWGS
jgi:hypothetical protein